MFKKYRKAFVVIDDNVMFAKPGLTSYEAFVESLVLTEREWENSTRGYIWGDTLVLYTYDVKTDNLYGSSSELIPAVEVLRPFNFYINSVFFGMKVDESGMSPIDMFDVSSGDIVPAPDNWRDYFFEPVKYRITLPDYVNSDYKCFIDDICFGIDNLYKVEEESSEDTVTVIVTSSLANQILLKLNKYDTIICMKEVPDES